MKTTAAGLSWSDRDVTAGRSAEGHSLLHCPGAGARKHGEPNQPSRLPEAAARPTSLLRVQNARALRVCQRCVSRAARDLRRELPECCRRHRRLACSRGLPRVCRKRSQRARTCRTCAKAVVMMCGSTSSKLWHAYRPFTEHAAGGRRPVQSKRAWVRSRTDILLRTFGANRAYLVRT